jgi:hypothetical protein
MKAARDAQEGYPIRWLVATPAANAALVDTSDATLDPILGGPGVARRLRSWGHDTDGVHFLAHRSGIGIHTDTAYLRYSHQLVLRNDGTQIIGDAEWDAVEHPPMLPGVMYCLDTWVPHAGVVDPRIADREAGRSAAGLCKVVIACDRPEPLEPFDAWQLVGRYLHHQLADFEVGRRPPRWRPGVKA